MGHGWLGCEELCTFDSMFFFWAVVLSACRGSSLQLRVEGLGFSAANENKAKKDLGSLPAIVQLPYSFTS